MIEVETCEEILREVVPAVVTMEKLYYLLTVSKSVRNDVYAERIITVPPTIGIRRNICYGNHHCQSNRRNKILQRLNKMS